MKIKIMYPNSKGKIELTKEELEKLLNEAYNEGYSDGLPRYYSYGGSLSTVTTAPYCNATKTSSKLSSLSYDSIDICDSATAAKSTVNDARTEAVSVTDISSDTEKELAWVYTGDNDKLTMVKTNEI